MTSDHPSPADFWKKLGLQFAAFVVVFALALWGASAGYQYWKSQSVLNEARDHLSKGNFRPAHGAAERALIEDPTLVDAAVIAAQALEKLNVPEVVEAWSRVSRMRKGSVDDAVRWARSALQWKREAAALGALQTVPENARENAAYHFTLGDARMAKNLQKDAAVAYSKAVALSPSNKEYLLRQASTVAIYIDDPAQVALAEKSLVGLTAQAEFSTEAYRALAQLKMRQKDWHAALAANRKLLDVKTPLAADSVQRLEILQQIGGPDFDQALSDIQKSAREAKDVAQVFEWMTRSGHAPTALKWAATMEPRIARNPLVARRIAESYLALKDWRALRKQCDELESWGDADHLRNAYCARALREMDDLINANHRWSAAIGASGAKRTTLSELLKLAAAWGWKNEQKDILWDAAGRTDERWAIGELVEIYTEEGSAEGLLRAYTQKTQLEPTDDESRSRMVHFSLLLDRAMENSIAQARMLAKRHPGEATYAATHALAELKGGRSTDALAAFSGIAADQLTHPEIALYHGLALFAAGKESEAAQAFSIAHKRRLLPEEKLLLPPSLPGSH
jgi:cytochrome c-type biogenesis protein CcmH/NrfG